MAFPDPPFQRFVEQLDYTFERPELLERALTHRSFANERGVGEHYERLEFLGDAVLGVLTAEWLWETYPKLPEGDLSKLKSQLVSTRALASHAEELGLGEALQLGVGEARSGGRRKASLLEDAFEAVLGAIWVDGGVDAARAFIRPLLERTIASHNLLSRADTKTHLQELLQAKGWELPSYRVVGEEGPDHSKTFHVECLVREEVLGRGEGPSKKKAEQQAAAEAVRALTAEPV